MLTLDQIDLSELADLLDQRDYGAGYLDPATGEIYPAFDGQIVGRDEDELVDTGDADTDGLIALGGESGREVYRDMQSFTDAIRDRRLRDQLTSALDGPKPMRAFRSAVHSTPERLGSTWQQFRNLRAQVRALDFLGAERAGGEPLVSEVEVEGRRAQLVDEADACLAGLGRGSRGRLVLLNGLPGVGKSHLAREYVASRPGSLNLDIDILRTLIGGAWEETAALGRSLALSLIEVHLDAGHEVVVPQLVADPDQLQRFEEVAEGSMFIIVLLEGESHLGDRPWQTTVTADDLDRYRQRLDLLMSQRPDALRLRVTKGDVPATLTLLQELVSGVVTRPEGPPS